MAFDFNRTDKAVEHLEVGETLWAHGYLWRVNAVAFDQRGNTGSQRRYIVNVDNVPVNREVAPIAPEGYRTNVDLGFLEHAFVTVVR